jgi:hypothetical protein
MTMNCMTAPLTMMSTSRPPHCPRETPNIGGETPAPKTPTNPNVVARENPAPPSMREAASVSREAEQAARESKSMSCQALSVPAGLWRYGPRGDRAERDGCTQVHYCKGRLTSS